MSMFQALYHFKHDTLILDWQQLTSSGDLSYLGAQWRQDVAFAGYNIALQVCLSGHCPVAVLTLPAALHTSVCS